MDPAAEVLYRVLGIIASARRLRSFRREAADRRLLASSPLFDARWYAARYTDVKGGERDAMTHYLRHGAREGRDPGPGFQTRKFLAQHPGLAASGENPLVHFLLQAGSRTAATGAPADAAAPSTDRVVAPARSATPGPLPARTRGTQAPPDDAATPDRERLAQLERRTRDLERTLRDVERRLDREVGRVDAALGATEGVFDWTADYHAYRDTPEYAEVFEVEQPLVSVCIATLDRAPILVGRAIASVRAQTYQNLEVIVVGDHCLDDTGGRIAALGDDRITFVNLPERGPYPPPGRDRWRVAGTNPANHALTFAKGRFVTHLDDDDAMVPHRIETLVSVAQAERADFLWHAFWAEEQDGTWIRRGDAELRVAQVTTGSILYHRYFARFPWDVGAYRVGEPGDWNRLRKIKLLRPRGRYVDEPLLYHHAEQSQAPFVAREGERFLD